MARIDDLRSRLFRSGETFKERADEPELLPEEDLSPHVWGGQKPSDEYELLRRARRRRRILFWMTISVLSFLLIVAVGLFLFLGQSGSATSKNVSLSVVAPASITAGDRVRYEIRFKNNNQVALESTELTLEFPPGARPIHGDPPRGKFRDRRDIGTVNPGEERIEQFEAYVFGKEGSELGAAVSLEYRPSNSSARFGNDARVVVLIQRSPIGVTLAFPGEAQVGQEFAVDIHYVSSAETAFADVSLDIAYPAGFEFIAANPAPVRSNNTWYLGEVTPYKTGTITLRGKLTGAVDDTKTFTARIGHFDEVTSSWSLFGDATHTTLLTSSLLAVDVFINGRKDHIAKPGETIVVALKWKNNLPVVVTDVILTANVSGTALDYAVMSADMGTVDGANRRVVWNAGTNPALKTIVPGATGQVVFSTRVLSTLPVRVVGDKNFTITMSADITTNITPPGYEGVNITGKNSVSFKIASRMDLVSEGRYYSGILPNTGPLPPQKGVETGYTLTWALSNLSNDVENVEVRAVLPSYADWTGAFNPGDASIAYNSDTGEVVWDVGVLEAGTGYIRPAREVSFKVSIVPGPELVGRPADIMFAAAVTGSDVFTGEVLKGSAPKVNTALRSDPQVKVTEYNVAP